MKDKIRSLLGIEMSLGQRQFKPFLLLLGIFLFIGLLVPLFFVYVCLYVKNTLKNNWNQIKKSNKISKYNGIKGV